MAGQTSLVLWLAVLHLVVLVGITEALAGRPLSRPLVRLLRRAARAAARRYRAARLYLALARLTLTNGDHR